MSSAAKKVHLNVLNTCFILFGSSLLNSVSSFILLLDMVPTPPAYHSYSVNKGRFAVIFLIFIFKVSLFVFFLFFWCLYLCSNTRTTYAFVTPAHSSGCNWNYLYNKQALFWKMPHSICESPSSLHSSTEDWPESCWHQHKGAHSEWRLYLPYSNKQSLCSLLIQPAFRIYRNKIPFLELSVFWSVKRCQHFGK